MSAWMPSTTARAWLSSASSNSRSSQARSAASRESNSSCCWAAVPTLWVQGSRSLLLPGRLSTPKTVFDSTQAWFSTKSGDLNDGIRGHGFDPRQLHQLQHHGSERVNRRAGRFVHFLSTLQARGAPRAIGALTTDTKVSPIPSSNSAIALGARPFPLAATHEGGLE